MTCMSTKRRVCSRMTAFYSVVTFRRRDDQKMKKINVLRFLRKKTCYHKFLNISHLELKWISASARGGT